MGELGNLAHLDATRQHSNSATYRDQAELGQRRQEPAPDQLSSANTRYYGSSNRQILLRQPLQKVKDLRFWAPCEFEFDIAFWGLT